MNGATAFSTTCSLANVFVGTDRSAVAAQHWRVREGLKVELADVCVDNREALLREHRAIGQTQPIHLAFLDPVYGPRFRIAVGNASKESPPSAQRRCSSLSFVGAPDLITP